MAAILSDTEIKKLFGKVIMDANESCLRPNSYILRLGAEGEFLGTGAKFDIGKKGKRGIRIPMGDSVGVTAREKIDFSRETVREIFPDCDLHGILSPTTDLSREGISAHTTQIDAGYKGRLNWTLTNNSKQESAFVYEDKIYRLTIFRLEKGEIPDNIYDGSYQEQEGYIPSKRKGAPVGMKESEWATPYKDGKPEELLDQLIAAGFPWSGLAKLLKELDSEFKTVTDEYSQIGDSIEKLNKKMDSIENKQQDSNEIISKNVAAVIENKQDKWIKQVHDKLLISMGAVIISLVGIAITLFSNQNTLDFLEKYGSGLGLLFIVIGVGIFVARLRK